MNRHIHCVPKKRPPDMSSEDKILTNKPVGM